MIPLNDDQVKAIKKLNKLRVGALFMEPGTGKTRTALELVKSSKADFVLFVVPFQTKSNLEKELQKWKFKFPYRIEGIESLSSSDRLYLELLDEVKKHPYSFIVCDESLKIKNLRAKRTKRILKIGKYAYYKLVLNGTPISKNVLDLYTQMEFLSPKILDMNFAQFMNTFVEYEVHENEYERQTIIRDNVNIDYLYSLIEPYVFEAKLDTQISENEHEIDYVCDEPEKYYQAKEEMLHKIKDMGDIDFLAMTQKMQHSYSLDDAHIEACKYVMNKLKRKTLIFVKYVETKEKLEQLFTKAKVITYGKGALGLNLQDYKNIIFYEKTWDYAQLEQAKRRIYRIGQSEDVNYYFLTGDLGLESLMDQSIQKKTSLLNLFKQATNKREFANEF